MNQSLSSLEKLKNFPTITIGGKEVYVDDEGKFCIKEGDFYTPTIIDVDGVEISGVLSFEKPELDKILYHKLFTEEIKNSLKQYLKPKKENSLNKLDSHSKPFWNFKKETVINEKDIKYVFIQNLKTILDQLRGKEVGNRLNLLTENLLVLEESILKESISKTSNYNGKVNKKEILGKEYIKVACKKNGTTFPAYLSLGENSEFIKVDGWYLASLGKFKKFMGLEVASAKLINEKGKFRPCYVKQTNDGLKVYQIEGKDVVGINKEIKEKGDTFIIKLKDSNGNLETIYFDPITYKVFKNIKKSLFSLFNTKKLDPKTGKITTLTERLVA